MKTLLLFTAAQSNLASRAINVWVSEQRRWSRDRNHNIGKGVRDGGGGIAQWVHYNIISMKAEIFVCFVDSYIPST